jgi:hypothetical protein
MTNGHLEAPVQTRQGNAAPAKFRQNFREGVIPDTLAPRDPGYVVPQRTFTGRRAMGNLGKRTALIFVVTLMLMGIGWDVALTKLADTGSHVHCSIHSSIAICISES